MHRPIVNAISDEDFKNIVESSQTMTELSLKLGFKHKAGGEAIKRIKTRMEKLNIKMKEKPKSKKEILLEKMKQMQPARLEKITFSKDKDNEIKIDVNFSNSNEVGLVGEKNFEFMCARYGINFFKELTSALPYDYLILLGDEFKKVQVKTSEKIKDNKLAFENKHGRYIADKKELYTYSKEDVDLFYLYSIELDTAFVVESTEKNPGIIYINLDADSGRSNVRYANDYTFKNFLKNYYESKK